MEISRTSTDHKITITIMFKERKWNFCSVLEAPKPKQTKVIAGDIKELQAGSTKIKNTVKCLATY